MAQSPLNIDSRQRWNLGYWMIALLLLMLVQSVWQGSSRVEAVPYSAFEKALAEGRITEVTIAEQTVTGKLKAPENG